MTGPQEVIILMRALATWDFFFPLAVQGYAQLNYTFCVSNILIINILSDETLSWEENLQLERS